MNTKAFIAFCVLLLLLANPIQAAAGGLSGAPGLVGQTQGAENSASVTFAQLGYADSVLVGPLDGTRKTFSTPANWQLKPGGQAVVDFDVTLSGADVGRFQQGGEAYSGTLIVSFNKIILGYIQLSEIGSQTRTFPIPEGATTSIRESGQHELDIQLNAQLDCVYDIRTTVVVKATSRFDLMFDITSPELNLSRLPAPFYLRNSLLPDQTLLVVPKSPAVDELRAALDVMAGFGSLIENPFGISLVTEDQLTDEQLGASNLIFVGMPGSLSRLEGIAFPAPVSGGKFSDLPAESANDGVLELAHSPWNPNKVILLVSGNTGEAVVKAAQAAGAGNLFTYANPSLSYIRDVHTLSGNAPIVEDFTLQDLGYSNQQLSGIGIQQADFSFFAAKEQLATDKGLLRLVYYHSGLLDYGVSSISVELNGQAVFSVPFSKDTEQVTTAEVKIPTGLLRFGENQLRVQARMQPDLSCDFSGFSDPWLMVSNQTALHLPLADVAVRPPSVRLDLSGFPEIFMTQSDLGDVAFVLAENDPAGWKIASDLAYDLGANSRPAISNLAVAYAADVPGAARAAQSFIVVGKASNLPFVKEVNDFLPAPFNAETNTAEEKGMQVVYRFPPNVSVGYLELAPSPFNPEKLLLVVSGNSDDGIGMSGLTLRNSQLRDRLTGVFAITNGVQVDASVGIAHFSNVGSSIPGAEQAVVTPVASPQPFTALAGPAWLLPFLAVSGALLLLIIIAALVGALRRNRTPRFEDEPKEDVKPEETK